jgi:hypothetical protein
MQFGVIFNGPRFPLEYGTFSGNSPPLREGHSRPGPAVSAGDAGYVLSAAIDFGTLPGRRPPNAPRTAKGLPDGCPDRPVFRPFQV